MNLAEPTRYATPTAINDDRAMGAILVKAGRLSADNAERILQMQKAHGRRFGDVAVELGLLSEEDIRFAFSSQFDYPNLAANDDSLSHELLAAYQPHSSVVEHLRVLRSQLMLRWFSPDAKRKALAIVSPGNSEGRSFIAANLAIVFSQLGIRTLLIDADLRAPRQHELFNLGRSAGLSELLAGRAKTEAIVPVLSLNDLSVLPAGTVPPNPQELLGRPAFTELLLSSSHYYDVTIIDTPAATEYADAQVVAVGAGASLMLARKNQSSMQDIVELSQCLQQSGATMVGSVLNDF